MRFETHYACIAPSHTLDSTEKAALSGWLNDFSSEHHIAIDKIKIEIYHIPSSESQQELADARFAVEDMSKYFSAHGIKKIKVSYEKFYELNFPVEVCKDIELEIGLSE